MDFGLAFVLGFLGSLHCAAMCGPLLLALPVAAGGAGRFVAGRILYQLGRVLTYCVLGGVAGLVGQSFWLAGMQRGLSLGLGVMILVGFFLSRKLAISAPAIRWVAALKTAMSAQLRQRTFSSLALLGMLNGLLPCGLVYAALAGAMTRGHLAESVAYMAIFGLGTLPMMLFIGLSGRLVPLAWRLKLHSIIPLGICLLSALLILRGLALGIPFLSPGPDSPCCRP